MPDAGRFNVLFLCTHNSARSLLAEAILNHTGRGRFSAFSAGSHPAGQPHPLALATLARLRFATAGLRSKDWREFARVANLLKRRIELFVNLPLAALDRLLVERRVRGIGHQ